MMLGRLLILISGALALITVDRLVNTWWLGPVASAGRSFNLGIAFVCGALAPLVLGVGFLCEAFADRAVKAEPDNQP